jgi:radical SAM superfamily enzyme YgiQ (UPF0313 family)
VPEPKSGLVNGYRFNFAEKRFPLGVGYLISVIRNAGHEVDFIDRYLLGPVDFDESKYDFIGMYSCTPCFEDTKSVMDKVTKPFIVGGPHVSVFPDTVKNADWIVLGEGERAILDILDGKVEKGYVKYPRIDNLDDLPFPAYDVFVKSNYVMTSPFFEGNRVFNMITSRGCPFSCTFCNTKEVWGRKYTYHSSERVVSDIKRLIKDHNVDGIYFREDNFTLRKDRLKSICETIIESGLKFNWACETRVDTLNEELVSLMAKSGCKGFYMGLESGSPRMLEFYKKGITPEQGLNVSSWCLKYGIKMAGSFITNHPIETQEDVKLTEDFIKNMNLNMIWRNKFREGFTIPKS